MNGLPEGYNKLRWDCAADGCFNVKRRPKIEMFADCFPRRINFGDVDGIVELNGFFCLLEWKGAGGAIKTGQRITFEKLTATAGNCVFVIEGDAETMTVERLCKFWKGKRGEWAVAQLGDVKESIRGWVRHVNQRNGAC